MSAPTRGLCDGCGWEAVNVGGQDQAEGKAYQNAREANARE